MQKIKIIFWDFDGVIMNSNSIRDIGFEEVLKDFPKDHVSKLMEYHRANGGLSRYVKFRYFFEVIRGESITDAEVDWWANQFSIIMRRLLVNDQLLIEYTMLFITENYRNYRMHITSGSDQEELVYICKELGIYSFFISIHGSPKPKKEWISELISSHSYNKGECVLIGDSINDWEASEYNQIKFLSYNGNEYLNSKTNTKFRI
jgi:HAD superfamily hydrolase (TIGR01549 family)